MAKLKNPFLSFDSFGKIARTLTLRRTKGDTVLEEMPIPFNPNSPPQIVWRTLYQQAAHLWTLLSGEEQAQWKALASHYHTTAVALFISKALSPNPGIYLPLLGGTMQGEIDMDSHAITDLPTPTLDAHPATKKYVDDSIPGTQKSARVYHNTTQSLQHNVFTYLTFNSERWDNDAIHSTTTNPTRLTCKTAGLYLIGAYVAWQANATGTRILILELNRTISVAVASASPDQDTACRQSFVIIYPLTVDQYLEIDARQNSGIALNVNYSPQYSPEFYMIRLGPAPS
jgi:hypothetical protein